VGLVSLTLVFEVGNMFWIEIFNVPVTSLAGSGGELITEFDFQKPGQILGFTVGLTTSPMTRTDQISCVLHKKDGTVINLDNDAGIDGFETQMRNQSSPMEDVGACVVFFFRGSGR